MPILSLPDEALVEILKIVIYSRAEDMDKFKPLPGGPKPRGPLFNPLPILFSQVSTFFRRLVYRTPGLWAILEDATFMKPLFLKLHLDISGECLLDIFCVTENIVNKYKSAIKPLLPHAHRWRSLRLDFYEAETAHLRSTCRALRALEVPKLETIDMWHVYYRMTYDVPIVFRGGCPSLTAIRMFSIIACLPYNSSTVTSMFLGNVPCDAHITTSYTDLIDILAEMPNLERIEFQGHVFDVEPPLTLEAVHLPKLKTLEVDLTVMGGDEDVREGGPPQRYLTTILKTFMHAPLTHLYLFSEQFYLRGVILGLRKKEIVFSHVETLHWGFEGSMSFADSVAFAEAFPALKDLVLANIWPNIICALGSKSKALWRHLHKVQLPSSCLFRALQLVNARIRAGLPLKCVQITGRIKFKDSRDGGREDEEETGDQDMEDDDDSKNEDAVGIIMWMKKHVETLIL
ncbi:hypothetical protein HWV62_1621 [Athelia sp. TMB]|nr:hypothetical protein HWV62_1621 [Athelia sp. TMB]